MTAKQIRLRIGSVKQAVLMAGHTVQDPTDALNELISNAADEHAKSARDGERILVVMRRPGGFPRS